MTTYAYQETPRQLLAVWPTGLGHRAETIASAESVPAEHAQALCYRLTRLSECLWETYARPASAAEPNDFSELWRREDARSSFDQVLAALDAPNVPDGQGLLEVTGNPVEDDAHALGRLLSTIGSGELTKAVTAEVDRELRAVERAERGDLRARAAQAVVLDRLDVSPVQVEAADQLLADAPLGTAALLISVDPAAACIAAAHWLAAAVTVVTEVSGVEPAEVFATAGQLHPASETIPTLVVRRVLIDRQSPRDVVHDLLRRATAAQEGRIPDLAGLLAEVAIARRAARQLPEDRREEALGRLLPKRTTPLDPMHPARNLLEHLLDGIRSCLVVLVAQVDEPDARSVDRADRIADEFVARVQEVAMGRRERLG